MDVYILRHGIAEDNASSGKDSDRALTEEGRSKLRQVLKLLAGAQVRVDTIVSSPYLRARQTAEIAKEVLGYEKELAFSDALVPEGDPQDVWHEIRTVYKSSESILLASHQPLVGRCTGYLLGVPELAVDFKKGAVVRIDFEQFSVKPRGMLRWMVVPKLAGA
jgi:phosphohistidine phosphatase